MRAVIQRCLEASVEIDGNTFSQIGEGLLVLVGIEDRDTDDDIDYLSKKICALRIFPDESGVMNRSIRDLPHGEILLVSQFTLMASTKKGNRPSYIRASRPEVAIQLYQKLGKTLERELGHTIQYGQFGADMQIKLINNGPVTIIIDSHDRSF